MIFLRFPDESTAMNELRKHGFTQTDDNGQEKVITASHQWAIDCIGPIYHGGSYDPETGDVIEPPTLLEGFHINYIGPLPDGWEQYAVHPKRPKRVFA